MGNFLSPLLGAIFWLIILATLAGAAWWVLRASAAGQAHEGDRADIDVYADQVAELDRDLVQGRISVAAADAGRLEIGRRLVKARDRILSQGPRLNRLVLGGLAAGVAVLAGGLYATLGSAGRADMPFAARERELLSRDPASLTQDEILILLQERARENSTDPQPHALMGQVLAGAGREQDALRAYQAVLRRTPNDSEAIAEAAAILTRLNGGVIGADAQAAFDGALKINPKSPAARFYLGLSDWQRGRKDAAMIGWESAYKALSEQPRAQEILAARVAQTISQLDRGPDTAAKEAGATMTPAQQSAVVATMVEGRTARLVANPSDVALRLSVVRVLMMTGATDKARATLIEGVESAEDNGFVMALYGVTARTLAPPARPNQPVTER